MAKNFFKIHSLSFIIRCLFCIPIFSESLFLIFFICASGVCVCVCFQCIFATHGTCGEVRRNSGVSVLVSHLVPDREGSMFAAARTRLAGPRLLGSSHLSSCLIVGALGIQTYATMSVCTWVLVIITFAQPACYCRAIFPGLSYTPIFYAYITIVT